MTISRIGPFSIEEPLDPRGARNVLRAIHLERKESMAVKLLPRSLVQPALGGHNFVDDIRRLQRLEHPGIVRTLGGAVEGGQPYLVLELVQGESLRDLLDRRGKLPWERAIEIVDGICQALKFAHQHGYVHQRLTPSRVLLPETGGVKVAGFDCKLTDVDAVLGLRVPMEVAHYLAPEEFRGRQSASQPPCDLFSVGVILYECLTGQLPWQASSPAELVQARRNGEAPSIRGAVLDCPMWLDMLVAKLLVTKRSERLASAEETHRAILNALRKAAAGLGTAQQALSAQKGALQLATNSEDLKRLRRHLRPTQRDDSPFYERAWFLALCLVLLIAGGVWSLLPLGEDELFARAQPLIASDNPVDHKEAEEYYVKPLLARFPDTKYKEQLAPFLQLLEIDEAQDRELKNRRLGRPAQTEAERLYSEAYRLELAGDRTTAWAKYESLVTLLSKKQDKDELDDGFAGLAKSRIEILREDRSPGKKPVEFARDRLAEARKLVDQGDLFGATQLLDRLVVTYGNSGELQPLMDQARALKNQIARSGNPPE